VASRLIGDPTIAPASYNARHGAWNRAGQTIRLAYGRETTSDLGVAKTTGKQPAVGLYLMAIVEETWKNASC
jgi:hypothetical protein